MERQRGLVGRLDVDLEHHPAVRRGDPLELVVHPSAEPETAVGVGQHDPVEVVEGVAPVVAEPPVVRRVVRRSRSEGEHEPGHLGVGQDHVGAVGPGDQPRQAFLVHGREQLDVAVVQVEDGGVVTRLDRAEQGHDPDYRSSRRAIAQHQNHQRTRVLESGTAPYAISIYCERVSAQRNAWRACDVL
jgi:hypothetical protein